MTYKAGGKLSISVIHSCEGQTVQILLENKAVDNICTDKMSSHIHMIGIDPFMSLTIIILYVWDCKLNHQYCRR